jgi:DNA modification methylase
MKQVKNLPVGKNIKNGDIFEIENKTNHYTHSFFKYPAKFVPEIPNWFLRNFTKERDVILDCFCGSGTSLVEAVLMNRVALGIDFDPLSHLLTKTKTKHLKKKEIQFIKDNCEELIKPSNEDSYPDIENLDHCFNKENKEKLSNIITNIKKLETSNQNIVNFLLTAFASIIRKSSNADQVSPKPYVSSKVKQIPKDANLLFLDTVKKNLAVYSDSKFKPKFSSNIIGSDARQINGYDGKIDHVITSPPYINAFDYVRVLRLENLWLNNFSSAEILDHKKKQIGNELIPSSKYKKKPDSLNIPILDEKILKIYSVDKIRSHIVYEYFYEMNKNFIAVHSCLKKGGTFCIVIGNSVIRNEEIETNKFFIALLKKLQFKLIHNFSYKIKNPYLRIPRSGKGGIISMDHIIVVKKI